MSDYKVFNDTGVERTWEELYEDNVLLHQENSQLKERIEKAIEFINIYTNEINLEAFDFLKLMYKIEEILKFSK